jgi:hypothetical protein
MEAFTIHDQLVADYRAFTSGFVDIRDRRLAAHVAHRLESGAQWPDPWVSLPPNFASGERRRSSLPRGFCTQSASGFRPAQGPRHPAQRR